jgi:hypothetical protein
MIVFASVKRSVLLEERGTENCFFGGDGVFSTVLQKT